MSLDASDEAQHLALLVRLFEGGLQWIKTPEISAAIHAEDTSLRKYVSLLIARQVLCRAIDVHALAQNRGTHSVGVIARAILENRVDIENLCLYDDYAELLAFHTYNHQRKALEARLNILGSSTTIRELARQAEKSEHGSLQEMLEETKVACADFDKQVKTPQFRNKKKKLMDTPKQRFIWANLVDAYETYYRHYSPSTHGTLGSMLTSAMSNADGTEYYWPPAIEREPYPWVAVDLTFRCSTVVLQRVSGVLGCALSEGIYETANDYHAWAEERSAT